MEAADVPGLAGIIASQQRRQQQQAGDLQNVGQVLNLQAMLKKRADDDALSTALEQSGGDIDKALEIAVKSGNIAAAHQLAPLAEIKRKKEETAALGQVDTNDPASLRSAAMRLKKPELITHAERIEKQREEAATLKAMQSGQQQIAPDQQEISQAADQGMPVPQPATVQSGGMFDDLAKSPIPHIAAQAKQMQAQLDRGGAPSAYWQKQHEALAAREGQFLQAKAVADSKKGPEVPQATDDTLSMDAWRYLTDGTLPPNMGRGVQGTAQATKIRNEASKLAKEMGMSPDEIRFAQLNSKTQVQAIGQLAKAKAQILQFEKTAELNANLALQGSEKVDRTGVPVLNKWIQAGRVNIVGDPEASAFHAATETFVNEYAKVMSGGYGAAATTEGAQNRAHTLLNTAQTKEQFRRVVTQLKAEMGNRVKALNDQMAEERQNLRSGVVRPVAQPGPQQPTQQPQVPGNAPQPAVAAPAGITATNPQTGQKVQSMDGGKTWQPMK